MWVDITREETYYLISSAISSHPLDKSQKHQITQYWWVDSWYHRALDTDIKSNQNLFLFPLFIKKIHFFEWEGVV